MHKIACRKQNCRSACTSASTNAGAGASASSCANADVVHGQQEEVESKKGVFITRALEGEECAICLELVTDLSNFLLGCGH